MISMDKQNETCEECIHKAVCVMKSDICELRTQCDDLAAKIASPYRSLFPITIRCELFMTTPKTITRGRTF